MIESPKSSQLVIGENRNFVYLKPALYAQVRFRNWTKAARAVLEKFRRAAYRLAEQFAGLACDRCGERAQRANCRARVLYDASTFYK